VSAAFYIKIEQTKAFLIQGQVGLAQSILNELSTETTVENRWRDHYLGVIKMHQGSFDQAISLLLNTLSKNGYHLSVILDLALCYQSTGEMHNWQKMVDLASEEFKNNHEKLSQHKKIKTGLQLAKCIEEKGRLSEALEIYADLLKLVQQSNQQSPVNLDFITISAQILRLHGQYFLKEDVSNTYKILCSEIAASLNSDADIETQRALMIYELNFLGADVCWSRYQRTIQNPMMQMSDKIRIQSDLYYGFLVRGFKHEALQILLDFKSPMNVFTESIRTIIQAKDLGLEKYMECITRVTPAAHLRLLKIWKLYSKNTVPVRRQKRLMSLFSKNTKFLWENYFNFSVEAVESKDTKVTLKLTSGYLTSSANQQRLKLSKNSNEIMKIFIGKNEVLLPELLKSIWNSNGTDLEISLLRQRVSRLNSQLFSKLGLMKCLQMTKTHLSLNYALVEN
jgi:tetratricopeptide (TPR) repeat protein